MKCRTIGRPNATKAVTTRAMGLAERRIVAMPLIVLLSMARDALSWAVVDFCFLRSCLLFVLERSASRVYGRLRSICSVGKLEVRPLRASLSQRCFKGDSPVGTKLRPLITEICSSDTPSITDHRVSNWFPSFHRCSTISSVLQVFIRLYKRYPIAERLSQNSCLISSTLPPKAECFLQKQYVDQSWSLNHRPARRKYGE